MTYNQVIRHYKTQTAVAAALKTTQPTVANWKARNRIPPLRQLQLEALTGGVLKADKKIKLHSM